MNPIRLLQQALDRLSLYIPVLLMGLLALGTWWLVRNAPAVQSSAVEVPNPSAPDYFMKSFSVKSFDAQGRLQSEVFGEMARHYPGADVLEIDKARLRSRSPEGQLTVATADRALSNADGSEVQLFGNAVVTREALPTHGAKSAGQRMEFRSEFLHAFLTTQRVSSNQPVTLIRGNDRFTADGMSYDHVDQILELRGRVRGTLVPAAGTR